MSSKSIANDLLCISYVRPIFFGHCSQSVPELGHREQRTQIAIEFNGLKLATAQIHFDFSRQCEFGAPGSVSFISDAFA